MRTPFRIALLLMLIVPIIFFSKRFYIGLTAGSILLKEKDTSFILLYTEEPFWFVMYMLGALFWVLVCVFVFYVTLFKKYRFLQIFVETGMATKCLMVFGFIILLLGAYGAVNRLYAVATIGKINMPTRTGSLIYAYADNPFGFWFAIIFSVFQISMFILIVHGALTKKL